MIAIVGKPNVGKSTFFSALTMKTVDIGNYPFTTIEPNEGVAYVRHEEPSFQLNLKANPKYGFIKGKYRFTPIKVTDVAGLVPGASEGRGLGNQFLDNIRPADGLILVIDGSGSTDLEGRVGSIGQYNPLDDVNFLIDEITLWIKGIILSHLDRMKKINKEPHEILYEYLSSFKITPEELKEYIRDMPPIQLWEEKDVLHLAKKMIKPIIICANRADLNPDLVKKIQKESALDIIPCFAEGERILKLADKNGYIEYVPGEKEFKILKDLTPEQKKVLDYIENYLKEFGNTGVQQTLEKLVYEKLNYITIFPVANEKYMDSEGNILPESRLIKKGTTAKEFAYTIHSDIGEKFVRAIILNKNKIVGKDYVLEDGDIICIKTN
jgi:ribosome-binding ATPase YchF (GTP1/OBG family)